MPAQEYLLLSHPEAVGSYNVRMLTTDGRQVGTGVLPDGTSETRLDVSLLRKGIYLLVLENGIERHIVKFVKN